MPDDQLDIGPVEPGETQEWNETWARAHAASLAAADNDESTPHPLG